jgi:hypothetical protein
VRSWWPIPAKRLDRKRLLGEHCELHVIGLAVAGRTKGWRNHPEVKRWVGHTQALRRRHDEVAEEMRRRGYRHQSPWPLGLVEPYEDGDWPGLWEPLGVMRRKLRDKLAAG